MSHLQMIVQSTYPEPENGKWTRIR